MYLEIFQNHIGVVEHIRGLIGLDTAMLSKVCKDFNKELDELSDEVKQRAQEECIATAFLMGTDQNWFGKLLDKLQNDYLQGYNCYSKSLSAAYNLLVNWKAENPPSSLHK